MGVYHVMGLGMSPGAVTSVLYYLRDRLRQGQHGGTDFFGQSGEWGQRSSAEKPPDRPPGYVQGLVLLTTPELYAGDIPVKYEEGGREKQGLALSVIKAQLQDLREGLTCKAGAKMELLVGQVPFRNFETAFERSLAVLHALHPPGRTGKEVWVNLTAGDNTLVLALHVASALTAAVGRLYCINVPKEWEKRLTHPVPARDLGKRQDGFWVDLPVLAVQDQEVRSHVLSILEGSKGTLSDEAVLGQLRQVWTRPDHPLPDIQQFRRQYLHGMEAHQLIERPGEHTVRISRLGERVKHYFELARETAGASSLRRLADASPGWAHREEI